MLKFVAAALWICIATVGAVFYSFQATGATKDEGPKPLLGGLDYVSTSLISVPIIQNSTIQGYYLTKLVYTVDPRELAKLSVPAPALITDEVYSYLYANPQVDRDGDKPLDLDRFRNAVRDAINARIGSALIQEVLVEQLSYLSQDDIRDNAIRHRKAAAAAAQDAASGPASTEE